MTVLQAVERERSRLWRSYVGAGLLVAAATSCALLSAGVFMLGRARWMVLPRALPFLVWLVVLAADAAVFWWTWKHLGLRGTRSGVATEIERERTLRAGSLRGVLEVGDASALARLATKRMATTLDQLGPTLAPTAQRRARRRALQGLTAAVIAVALLAWLAPVFDDGLMALLLPVHAWRGTLLPKLEFRGLPLEIMRGEQLGISVVAPRRTVVHLTERTTGEGWRTVDIPVSGGIAKTAIGPVRGDVSLIVSDGRAVSDTALVRVTDRPFVGAVSMRAIYPAYLGRSSEGLPVGEPARVPQGTRIEIAGRASTELRDVRLVNGAESVALRPDGHAFAGQFDARTSGRWSWSASGMNGAIADLPLPLELEVVQDSAPRVEIVSPRADTIVAPEEQLALQITATDDHGLASIEMESWRQPAAGARQPAIAQRLAANQSTVWSGIAAVDLAPRGLQAGDVLHVKVIAIDNSPWAQRGESRELLLRIPTMEERRDIARAAADSTVREATAAAAAERSLAQRTSETARERERRSDNSAGSSNAGSKGEKDNTMSYDAAEKTRELAKDQRALIDRVKNLQQQAAALQQQLRQAGAMDSSLARQLREAQAMLREALTPELLAQMQKLEDATKQLASDQSRDALKDLAAMQQRLREQLEKSAEMLKRAAYEGSMQTLHDQAKELADRDKKFADSAAALSKQDQQQQAKDLADASKRLSDEVKSLEQRLAKDKAEAGAQRTDQARQHAEAAEEQMRAAANQANQNQQHAGADSSGKRSANASRSQRDSASAGNRSRQSQAGDSSGAADRTRQDSSRSGSPSEQKSNQRQKSAQANKSQQAKSGEQKPGAQKDDSSASSAGSNSGTPQQNQSGSQAGKAGEKSQSSGQNGNKGQQGENAGMSDQAQSASEQMERAAQDMQSARDAQVQEWKKELTGELDKAIQELLQMARTESDMEQKARTGQAKADELRGEQSALNQGVDKAAQQLQEQGQKSSLLSNRSQQAMGEARQKVAQATQAVTDPHGGSQMANALGDAAESLNRAAASLARDRQKANTANSASGFSEMLQQLQDLAKRQSSINAQSQGLLPIPSAQMSAAMQATARALARQQRQVAQQLDELGDAATTGDRAAQLAKEARQLADALDGGRVDAGTVARQQQLFRRLLDAGRTLEKDERDDTGKREAKSAVGWQTFTPENASASGRNAEKFREPTWNDLRGLTPDERRAILDYFKRINGNP